LHGLIRDEQGRKMSKTLANVIDPLEVMDEFGADALRLTLLTGSTPGNDMNLSVQRVEANRNFANKVWNAGRLVIGAVKRLPREPAAPAGAPTLADRWILARRSQVLRSVERLFDGYQYGEAGRQIYEFFWGEFADWYLEASKLQTAEGPARARATANTMASVLDTCLRLLHPFTPFVTEELWERLRDACQARSLWSPPGGWEAALIVARWPEADGEADDAESVRRFEVLRQLVRTIRNARAEKQVDPARRIGAMIGGGAEAVWLREQAALVCTFARIAADRLAIEERVAAPPPGSLPLTAGGVEIYLTLADAVDRRAEVERVRRDLQAAEAQVERLQALLAGPFATRAPADVVEAERRKLAEAEEETRRLRGQLKGLR
jgi:valyl-tRNA synthetase